MLLLYRRQDAVAACLQVLLERLTEAPETAVDAVSLLSAVERRTVLHTFNRTPICVPSGACQGQTIHGMLEYWAATTPAAPAAMFQVRTRARCRQACVRVGAAERDAMQRVRAPQCKDVEAVLQGGALSYAKLDKRANQLAHRLVRLGVRAEVPVGVMMERSLELVVALLGVLKAGGAYVPMDPSYPPDRLALMMED